MSVPANSDVPLLINLIFEKYEKCFEDPANRINSTTPINGYKDFFTELHLLFGPVLASALRILDTKSIIVYTTEAYGHRQLAEIHLGQGKVVKLYPQVNFCFCLYFQTHVLQLCAPSGTSESQSHSATKSYTCEHVLALRLAQLLRVPSLTVEQLPKEKFTLLLGQMNHC